jgi:CHAT domain-containing protein
VIQKPNSGRDHLSRGAALFQGAAYQDAIKEWEQSVAAFGSQGNREGQVEALIRLASGYHALGHHHQAIEQLEAARTIVEAHGDGKNLVSLKSSLGVANTLLRRLNLAESLLRESLVLARQQGDEETTAVVLNNLGNCLLLRQEYAQAGKAFQESAALAASAQNLLLRAQALVNEALTMAFGTNRADAVMQNEKALAEVGKLPSSHDKAMLLNRVGKTFEQIAGNNPGQETTPASRTVLLENALDCYQRALQLAGELGDLRLKSYSLGFIGHIYELRGEISKALASSRQALFAAQQAQCPESAYRWQWQAGRLLKAQNEVAPAIDSYRSAVATIRFLRSDMSFGYGNRPTGSSFRESVGPVYYELADLLLRQADAASSTQNVQQTLIEARDTMEQLKTVEMEDYFQDECVNLIRKVDVQNVSTNTAVIYLIPLADRIEMLLDLPGGLQRHTQAVGEKQLTEVIRKFRHRLEKRTTHDYMVPGNQLYDWLIRPIYPALTNQHIHTLVFVPDGALRTVPMAALCKGEKFLVQEFAVGVTPGLSLMEPRPFRRQEVRLMLNGVSESVAGFPALPNVPKEIESLQSLYPSERLLDGDFRTKRFEKEFSHEEFSIVHIASHGQFSSVLTNTFVLAYDGRLTLDKFEALLGPKQFRGKPVELLTLSACQTAAGDDRAVLGLAGVAVKAGARSAFATLWFVNDESTSVLVSEFYKELRVADNTKAQALRKAQLKLIEDPLYEHPCYWAPFLIIGNWL